MSSPAHASGTTVEELDGHVRVAIRKLEGDNRLVLLGFTPDRLLAEKAVRPVEYGFEPLNFKEEGAVMTPKYLFAANRHGIQTVYSLDMHDSFLQIHLLENSKSMPPVLIDAQLNRLKNILHKADGTVIAFAKKVLRIPIKAIRPFRQVVRLREYSRTEQAAGLNYLLYQAYMHCRFPSWISLEGECRTKAGAFNGAFTHADVAPIGEALRYRYRFGLQQQFAADAIGLFSPGK